MYNNVCMLYVLTPYSIIMVNLNVLYKDTTS